MASKKRSSEPSLRTILERIDGLGVRVDGLGVRVDSQHLLLEDLRSQNAATIEALEATRVALEQRIERLDQDSRSRDALLEVALRDLKVSVQQNSIDIRDLTGRVEVLSRLEERVAAIERRLP